MSRFAEIRVAREHLDAACDRLEAHADGGEPVGLGDLYSDVLLARDALRSVEAREAALSVGGWLLGSPGPAR